MNSLFPECESTVKTVLLLASLPTLSTPQFLVPAIHAATTDAKDRLVIVLFSRAFAQRGTRWDDVQRLLAFVYGHASKLAQDMDKVLLDVDVLLRGMGRELPHIGDGVEMVFRIQGDSLAAGLPMSLATVRQRYIAKNHDIPEDTESGDDKPELYPVVALGGTFDHLHCGHKILLSMALWITADKLIVGITDDALLKNKVHKDVLENLAIRKTRVLKFISLFMPGLTYDIVAINDVYGPTGSDPNIQALVVSEETLHGAQAIHDYRETQSLPPLKTFVVDVLSHMESSEAKMSSTFIREWIKNRRALDNGQ